MTGYTVQWNGGSGNTFADLKFVGAKTTIFTKEDLKNGQIYKLKVRA